MSVPSPPPTTVQAQPPLNTITYSKSTVGDYTSIELHYYMKINHEKRGDFILHFRTNDYKDKQKPFSGLQQIYVTIVAP